MADGSRSCGWQKWSGEWWRRDGSGEWKKWRGDGSDSGNGGAAVTPAQRTVAPPGATAVAVQGAPTSSSGATAVAVQDAPSSSSEATAVAVQGGHGEMFTVDFSRTSELSLVVTSNTMVP